MIELALDGVPANREELRRYGLCEEIIAYKRRWFVVLEDAPTVLAELLTHRKAIRDMTAPEDDVSTASDADEYPESEFD